MEENDGLHGQLRQIRVILHEIGVQRRERLRSVGESGVGVRLHELTDVKVAKHEVFQDEEQAGDEAEDE